MLILEPTRPSTVRERWARARSLGVRADSDAYPVGTSGAELAVRRDRIDDVFREEARMPPLAELLAARACVTVVADPDGVIVSARGGVDFTDPAARVRLVEGAQWSEGTRGTNAIGTAIAERRAVAVLGAAHFERRNRELFCYATPLHDPYGELVAVLDATGPIAAHDPAIGAAVEAAGAALERVLRALAYARSGARAFATIERLVHRCAGPAILIEANGAVRVVNAAASHALAIDRGAPLTCERLLGVPFAELEGLARAGGDGMRFETRERSFRVELDPIEGTRDRALALLVHFDQTRTSERRIAATQARHPAFDAILSRDPALDAAKDAAQKLAQTGLPVLLLAETGTGKELFARAIHATSPSAAGPFVALNCGALAPTLLESELFGYAPGAFTGASRAGSEGRIAAANGGTLFLDEIAEMPAALQAALLRVLDDGVYQRVGETRSRRATFRLVCATCRDLPAMVESGQFRNDLFYRIHGGVVTMPPLRARADREWLAEELLARTDAQVRLGEAARAWVRAHTWPGNVRELKSALAHAAAMAGADEIAREHFPRELVPSRPPVADAPGTRREILRDAVTRAVDASRGNLSEAARRLGVARSTLYRMMGGKKR